MFPICGYFWFICKCDTNSGTVPSTKRYTNNNIQASLVCGQQKLVCWLGIIAQGSADQGLKAIHYFQSMRLHNEAYREIVQANVESITKAVMSCKLIQLQKFTSLSICGKRIWFEDIFFSWTKYFEFNICFRSDRLCWAQCVSPGVSTVLGGVFGAGWGSRWSWAGQGGSYIYFCVFFGCYLISRGKGGAELCLHPNMIFS